MKIKKLVAALSLSAFSLAAAAEDYRVEVGASYVDFDFADGFGISGEVHFDEVSTSGLPLEEAAYLGHSNNAFLNYIDIDGDDITLIGVELYLNGFYFAPMYADSSLGDGEFSAALGYASENGWRVSTTVPEEDYEANVDFKYVTALSSGNYINFEASFEDGGDFGENAFTIGGDYYFDETLSVGAVVIDQFDTDFGIRANKFFTPTFRAGAMFISGDAFDTISIDASVRF